MGPVRLVVDAYSPPHKRRSCIFSSTKGNIKKPEVPHIKDPTRGKVQSKKLARLSTLTRREAEILLMAVKGGEGGQGAFD